ncbi:MAG: LamG domain-containing protein [Myxococcota bacterium]
MGTLVASVACTEGTFVIPVGSASGDVESSSSTSSSSSSSGSGVTGSTSGGSGLSGTASDCVPAGDDWWDLAWGRRRALEIDTSGFAGSLVNFPVLVHLDPEALGATWTERGGADLRFRDADGQNAFAYEIDDLGPDGRVPVWLEVPQINPEASPLIVWMYDDNPAATEGASPTDVWGDHVAVLHLGADLLDSTGRHHGNSQWEPIPCQGECEPKVGVSRVFTPEMVHEVVLEDSEGLNFGSDAFADDLEFSVSLWMRSDWFANYMWGPFVAKGDETWRVHTFFTTNFFSVGLDCQSPCGTSVDALGNYNLEADGFNVNDDQWHHIAMTFGTAEPIPKVPPPGYDPDMRLRLYVDGVEAASEVLTTFRVPADGQPVRLGHNANTQNRYRGALDELRIIDRALPPEWIMAEFAVVDAEPVSVGDPQVRCP